MNKFKQVSKNNVKNSSNSDPLQDNNDLTEEEILPYEELKEDKLFDVNYDILEYCRLNNPLILKYGTINELIDIMMPHVHFTNPFILTEDDLDSSDDEIEEN